MPDVLIEERDGVLALTWNRRDALNSLTPGMLHDAAEAVERAGSGLRLVTITGTGRAFSSGAALSGFEPSETLVGANRFIRAITRVDAPVLAAVNGLAAGVGASIAFAADLAVVKRSGYFLLAFVNVGLIPDGGATATVAASVGRARANRMALLGERLPAVDAVAAGLVAEEVDDDAFDARVDELVARLSTGPTAAYAAMKHIITAQTLPTLDAALAAESEGQHAMFGTLDSVEGVQAFTEKRPPAFVGR